MLSLACQEQLLPGVDLESKWDFARVAGYDAIELRGDENLEQRLPELRRARAAGVVLRTVCADLPSGAGRGSGDALLRSLLSVIAGLGGVGVVAPAAGIGDLAALGEHAAAEGVTLFLEPRNRYEDRLVNRLEQAARLIDEVGLPSVRIAAGTFHMNIEEDDPVTALVMFGGYVGHLQVSDSNRLQPGAGHVDWPRVLRALEGIGYTGDLALAGDLRGDPADAVASVPGFLRALA